MMRYLRNNVKAIMIGVVIVFVVSCFAGYGMYVRGRSGGVSGGDYPVAKVNGDKIMRSQIETGLKDLADQFGNDRITSKDVPLLRKMVLDDIVVGMELTRTAKEEGVEVSKEEVEDYLAAMQARFPTKEAYNEYVQRSGMTEREMKKRIEEMLVQKKLLDKVTANVSVDASESRKFYDAMKNVFFKRPVGYNLNVAAFRGKAVAEQARARLIKGEEWDKVIEALSKDVSNSTPYGKPVFVAQKDLADDLKSVISLKPGAFSPLVKVASDDYIIVLKRSNEPERIMPYDEVSKDIHQVLLNQKRSQVQRQYVQDLLKKAPVEILDKSIFEVPSDEAGVEGSNKGN
ncbi:peptidylprolyl isomerase [Thermanaerovibrio velox]|nr:SurA N-terminal domain-containing protein [Thermanaerovibrio velox]